MGLYPLVIRDALEKEIIVKSDERGDFVTGDDGFVVFWPLRWFGALDAWHLRTIADELDRRNKDWLKEMKKYFSRKGAEVI